MYKYYFETMSYLQINYTQNSTEAVVAIYNEPLGKKELEKVYIPCDL